MVKIILSPEEEHVIGFLETTLSMDELTDSEKLIAIEGLVKRARLGLDEELE